MRKREWNFGIAILCFVTLFSSCLSWSKFLTPSIPQEVIDDARANELPIIIAGVYTSSPNSAGGVDLTIVYKNISDRTIKYAIFRVEAFNRVDDPVRCEIRNDKYFGGRDTGPIEPSKFSGIGKAWTNAWYNNSITYAKIDRVTIIYMDNQEEDFSGKNIARMINSQQ